MKKNRYWVLLMIIAVSCIFLRFWQSYHWPTAEIELKDTRMKVLVADTYGRQRKGLGGRESLGQYGGMLFIHGESKKYGIVMRGMMFPIDIVWLEQGEIVDIAPNVQPEPGIPEDRFRVYHPRLSANAILELPAGWTTERGVKIGDRVVVISDY